MKTIIYPQSGTRVPTSTLRIILAFDALFALLFVGTQQPIFLVLVILDFIGRGTLNLRGSIFGLFLKTKSDNNEIERTTELDPKTFAARLGAVASSIAFILFFADYSALSYGIMIFVAGFSLSDAIFKRCFGSSIYTNHLKPYFDKAEKGIVREFKNTPIYKSITVMACLGFFPLLYLVGHFLAK